MTGLQLPYSEQPNLAPRRGLQRAAEEQSRDKNVFVDQDWFRKTKSTYLTENESTWQNQTLLWEMQFLFIEGKQLLRRGRYGGGWRTAPIPDRTDSPVFSQNLVGFYSDNIKAKWTQSNTDVNWRPTSDSDEWLGAAKAAQNVHDYYKRKLYTERFRQIEATLAQCGKYARYYYYSEDSKTYGRREKTKTQRVQFGPGYWFCADCGSGGDAADLQATAAVQPGEGFANNSVGTATDRGGINPGQWDAINAQFGHDELAEWQAGLEKPHAPELEQYEQDEANHIGAVSGGGGGIEPTGETMGSAGSGHVSSPMGGLCPACGSPNVEVEPPAEAEIEAFTGYEEVELGDLVCESVPAFELKHDLTKTPQDSPFLIRRRRIRVALLESKYPELAIKAAKREDYGLQAEDDLKRSTYNSTQSMRLATDATDGEPTADFIQVWLDPCLYSRITLKEDYQTISGQTVPAGTKLTEIFPDGMYSCWIEGIEGCIELRNEHHKDYFVGSEYRLRAISSLGSGLEDIIECQRQYNLIMSIIYTQLRTSAMPATLYDQRLLPNGVSSYLGSLQNIPVEMAALDDRIPISAAVHQLPPQPPTMAHFQYGDSLNINMQRMSRVTDVGLGQALGLDNKTATGAQLAAANAQGLFGPQLALKAEVDRRGAEIILALFKKYAIDERYVSLSGKRGEQDGAWLSAADIGVNLFAEVAGESYLPQTNFERRERWERFLMTMGGLPGLIQMLKEKPALVEQMAELNDVDLGSEDYTAAAELCRERIGQMQSALPHWQMMAQQMPPTQVEVDPMTGQAVEVPVDPMAEVGQFLVGVLQPPIEFEEDGHLQAIAYLRSWLTTDEGKKAPQELREGVKAMILVHLEGVAREAQMLGALGAVGDPMGMMQAEAQAQAQGQDEQRKGESHDSKMKTEQQKRDESARANLGTGQKRPSPKPQPVAA